MKTIFHFVSVLAWFSSLNAQITAILNRPTNRSPEVVVRNNSTVNLTAFALSMAPIAQGNASLVVFVDTAVDTDRRAELSKRAMPLPPNEECAVPIPNRFRDGQPIERFQAPIITAVFADGTTAGDAALLARLILRRGDMLQAAELAREILSDAGSHNVSRGRLVEQFRMMEESVSHWYLPPEQQVGRALYQSITEELMNLPPLQVGSAFPPTTYVEQRIAMLNRQRTTLLESPPGLSSLAEALPTKR